MRQREVARRATGRITLGMFLILAGVGIGLAILSWAWFRQRETARLTSLLAEARIDVGSGRYHTALEKLGEIAARRIDWNEVPFLVGLCEQGRGRPDAARAAWERVDERSEFGGLAALRQARAEMARGLLGQAETRLIRALDRPGPHRDEARTTLIVLLKFQDRRADIARLIRATVGEPPPPPSQPDAQTTSRAIDAIRQIWDLEHDPFPVAAVRSYLDEMARLAPRDGRVQLGLARLDGRAGRFEEADRRFEDCLRLDPKDPVVWRARLEEALAANRAETVVACLGHLPVTALDDARETAVELARLRAWLAARRDDSNAERKALDELIALAPADLPALERRAELSLRLGDSQAAATTRRRKDQRDRDRTAYANLLRGDRPESQARALAKLAADLGRPFDLAWWSTLAGEPVAHERTRSRVTTVSKGATATLADLLPELPPATSTATGREPPSGSASASAARFVDEAATAGLVFTFDQGRSPRRQLPETMSGGVGLIDYDGDGWLDVYAVQGGPFPPATAPHHPGGDRLFRNRGDGTFEDVTARAGLVPGPSGYGHGVAVGDVDNDGHADLFLTRWRSYVLLRNRGNGTFEDVTNRWNLDGDRDWPTSAGFADLDNDGDLDLYVCHYLAWDAEDPRVVTRPETGEPYYATPAEFPALGDHVFRNDGGRFVDVSASSGVQAADRDGRGLGLVLADLDDDGLIDVYVANDMSSNYLFRNLGGFRFEESGLAAGVATAGGGGTLAGMGVACGDLNGDGRPDLLVTNFFGESTTFYQNLGGGFFADHSSAVGLTAPTRDLLGFGLVLIDADNDGRLDVLSANGHVNDGRPRFPWMMPPQLLLTGHSGRFVDASATAGTAFAAPHLGRGLAAGDLDNDGRVDAVLVAQGEPLVFLHNQTPSSGRHVLTLRLQGTTSNRDAVGARVTVRTGDRAQTAWRVGGGSYLSASDPRFHFGLGTAERADSVEVRWPSGKRERLVHVPGDASYRLVEGDPRARFEGRRVP